MLELLRGIRTTLDQHTTALARLGRRMTSMGYDIAALRHDAARAP